MLANIEEQAAAAGIMKMIGSTGVDRHRVIWRVRCSRCPALYEARWSPHTSPDLMIKNMRNKQWDVGHGLRPLCPECAHPKKDHGPLPKPNTKWEPPALHPLPKTAIAEALVKAAATNNVVKLVTKDAGALQADAQAVQPQEHLKHLTAYRVDGKMYYYYRRDKRGKGGGKTKGIRLPDRNAPEFMDAYRNAAASMEPAPLKHIPVPAEGHKMANTNEVIPKSPPQPSMKITRMVFMWLDDYFDPNAHFYKAGFDDARIAKECGTTEEVVAYLRREAFGELAADPRIDTIKRDIAILTGNLETILKTVRELQSRVDQIATAKGK